MKSLTRRQKVFVDEYLVDHNAKQAAIRAGYSEKSAGTVGPKMLREEHISSEVDRRMRARSAENEGLVTKARQFLDNVLTFDIRRVVKVSEGKLAMLGDLSEAEASVIQSIEDTPHGVRVRLHSKQSAAELVMRIAGEYGGADDGKEPPAVHVHFGNDGKPAGEES